MRSSVEITSIFGLPAHPLFVHVPVVLVPLASLGAILMLWPKLRAKFGWATVVIAFVGLVFTQLAIGSGQALEEYVRETSLTQKHVDVGENLRPFALLLFGFTLAVMLWDWWNARQAAASKAGDGDGRRSVSATTAQRVSLGLCILAILSGIASTYWVYEIGHTGAKATWEKTQVKIDKGGSNGGEGGGESGEGGGG
jgi:uncharacterized membrane protein